MKHQGQQRSPVRRRGIALIIVVSVLALATILVLAMFSVTESEFKSTQSYAASQTARQLADSAVSIVISQIQAGSSQSTGQTGREFHATQPGAVRRYSDIGVFLSGYKLYSDSTMIVNTSGAAAEENFAKDVPLSNWNIADNEPYYVDLNEPAITASVGGAVRLSFPIVDPRAAQEDPESPGNPKVEGFNYYTQFKSKPDASLNGVVLPVGANLDDWRVPMPVEWMYILKDGTLGTLGPGRQFISAGAPASVANPIVGRIAFWTDDESCKLNINTASEPTFWSLPVTYHERAHSWAEKPPTMNEFQRFPGHPATVALSTVLYPNQDLDQYGKTQARVDEIVAMKEAIYQIMPKINNGGSMAGTVPYAADDVIRAEATQVGLEQSVKERLYATLDELLFSETLNGNVRARNDLTLNGTPLITPEKLERSRFFLTANSRSAEFTLFGTPRIAMWPVADESLGQERRTVYDKLIAFCATLDNQRNANDPSSPNTYYFRRKDPHSTATDVNLQRNRQLLEYLEFLMTQPVPKNMTLGGRASYVTKYGAKEVRQIIISIFDYIRATNTYDSFLAPTLAEMKDASTMPNMLSVYATKDLIAPQNAPESYQFKTYTEPRYKYNRTVDDSGRSTEIPDVVVADRCYPGHGQVSPSHWVVQGETLMGYGRSVTITEAALHFICTADGKLDNHSFKFWRLKTQAEFDATGPPWFIKETTAERRPTGGRTAARLNIGLVNQWKPESKTYGPTSGGEKVQVPGEDAYWYSNYPPFPSPGQYGTDPAADLTSPRHMQYHPGYDPENWNVTLDRDTPLAETEKRIQACLQLELFCPMLGWGRINPELTIVADGRAISAIMVNGRAIFSTTDDLVTKTEGSIFDTWGASPVGGTASFRNFVDGRRARGVRDMPNDKDYVVGTGGGEHADMLNLDLISSFVTIDRTTGKMTFEVPEPIRLSIYDDHDWQRKDPMQTITLNFPRGPTTVVCPDLVIISTEFNYFVNADGSISSWRAVEAPRWWTFNWAGCLRRFEGSAARYLLDPNLIQPRTDFNGSNIRCCGRLRLDGQTGTYGGAKNGTTPHAQAFVFAKTGSLKINMLDRDNPDVHAGTDVIRSIIPKYGDYRLIAARRVVGGDMWVKHPLWDMQDVPMAHNLTSFNSDQENGFDRSGDPTLPADATKRLVKLALPTTPSYPVSKIPDMPHTAEAALSASRYRDWDNGIGPARDGAYLNKVDEGNFSALYFWISNNVRLLRNAYYFKTWESQSGSSSYFTPNRMIPSPVIFGSIPTGVWGSGAPSGQSDAATHGVPWRTLLFRPDVAYPGVTTGFTHTGAMFPRDHYALELFYMPVVEPYAISEPLSVAGRININYQMLPFTHIRRATGMHAVLKSEIMNAVPKNKQDFDAYLGLKSTDWDTTYQGQRYWEEVRQDRSVPVDLRRYWHRKINLTETLKQMDDRLNFTSAAATEGKGLFRSPSQICEIHLIPSDVPPEAGSYPYMNVNPASLNTESERRQQMGLFWDAHALTGDNMRERPYATIYPRLTTRSNTFRVHIRSQAIRKARSTAPGVFEPTKDSILSEYRGSTLIERYIDPNDTRIPEYADGTDPMNKPSLETFYRFRVLENKRFVP